MGFVAVVGVYRGVRMKTAYPETGNLTLDSDGAPNLREGHPSEKVFYARALNYYNDFRQAEQALADYRQSRRKK